MLVLRDEDPVSRADTAMALAYAGGPSAAEPLAALLGDEDERVRMCAAWALAELGDPHAVDGLVSAFLESPSDKIYLAGGCAERLIQAGTDGVEALVEAAKSVEAGERGLRKIAIECLESAGHREEATRLRDHTEFEKHSRQRTERAEGLQEWAREAVTSPAEAARVLVGLYDRTPGGFVKSDSGADYVRAVGRRLDEIGGFEGMLEAHALFAAARPGMARNLEMVWDGVGTWAG
jgi:HEAT repeat protein